MPIKVGTTTVINDSRELENITNITGTYGNLKPLVGDLGGGTSETLSFTSISPVFEKVMSADTSFTVTNATAGATMMLLLDTAKSDGSPSFAGWTPTFPNTLQWANGVEPTWGDFAHWVITFVSSSTQVFASATGYN